jgi:hypothetical protein
LNNFKCPAEPLREHQELHESKKAVIETVSKCATKHGFVYKRGKTIKYNFKLSCGAFPGSSGIAKEEVEFLKQ